MAQKLLNRFISELEKIDDIKAVYLYGSILSEAFDFKKNDIDILIIANENNSTFLIKKIKKIKSKFKSKLRLDVGIRFQSELERFININRPPTAYFGIANKNKLVFGKDVLASIKNMKIYPKDIFTRVCNLAQGCRGLYLSREEKDLNFWIKYQRKWLIVAFLEVLYLDGVFELNKEKGLKLFVLKAKASKKILNLLTPKLATIDLLFESSEWLREYMLKKYSQEI